MRQIRQLWLACLIQQTNSYPIMAKLTHSPNHELQRWCRLHYDDLTPCSQTSQLQSSEMVSSYTMMMSSQNAMQQTYPIIRACKHSTQWTSRETKDKQESQKDKQRSWQQEESWEQGQGHTLMELGYRQ